MKRETKKRTIHLDGELEGMSFVFRSNPQMRHMRDLTSGDFDRISKAIGELLLETHGFVTVDNAELANIAEVRAKADDSDKAVYHLIGQYDTDLTLAIARSMIVNIGSVDPN